jgi:pyruvate dehydrogenase E2 component (dihydrolipoamide acetyltransferase)
MPQEPVVTGGRIEEGAQAARLAPEEELPAMELAEAEAEVEDASFRLRTQARRVVASQRAIPHFYITRGVDVTAVWARKDELKGELGVTITHVVAFACLQALKEHPEINRSYDRGRIIKWKGVNLGLAVETDEGLTVAVLRDAQNLSLKELADQSSALVERARARGLSAEERRHATFTITNLGMFDVEHFEPIINPPSSVTLAVSSALPAVLVRDEAIHVGRLMKLTAACDHRIIEGAAAARFLSDVRALLESPERLLDGQ